MSNIPKILFKVWFGQNLPQAYQKNLIKLKDLNPDYQLILYTDSSTMTKEEWFAMVTFCTENQIQLKNVQSESLENMKLVLDELALAKYQPEEKLRKLQFVRASDIMRIVALYAHGGIYLDIDIEAKHGFGDISCETGFIQTTFIPEAYYEFSLDEFYYDFIAAMPKQKLFIEALALHQSDLSQLIFQMSDLYKSKSSRQALRAYVLATTGSIFFYVSTLHQLQYLDSFKAKKDILYANCFVTRQNDNSWLPDALTPFSKYELYQAKQLVEILHDKRANLLKGLDIDQLIRIKKTILDTISPDGFPQLDFDLSSIQLEVKTSPNETPPLSSKFKLIPQNFFYFSPGSTRSLSTVSPGIGPKTP